MPGKTLPGKARVIICCPAPGRHAPALSKTAYMKRSRSAAGNRSDSHAYLPCRRRHVHAIFPAKHCPRRIRALGFTGKCSADHRDAGRFRHCGSSAAVHGRKLHRPSHRRLHTVDMRSLWLPADQRACRPDRRLGLRCPAATPMGRRWLWARGLWRRRLWRRRLRLQPKPLHRRQWARLGEHLQPPRMPTTPACSRFAVVVTRLPSSDTASPYSTGTRRVSDRAEGRNPAFVGVSDTVFCSTHTLLRRACCVRWLTSF